jgi:hypothetical protein
MAGEEDKGEGKGFKVADRRRFSPDTGEVRESTEESKPPGRSDDTGSAIEECQSSEAAHQAMPEINFSTFVISLSTQALMNLGEISNPLTGKVEVEIPVAKQMIDILGMLREKTRGNLDPGEEKLVEDILFDLRMKYVEAVKTR